MISPILYVSETDSTNRYIKEINIQRNLMEETVVYTDFQTAGRGQKGNSWESEKDKNLLFSMVLYPNHIKIQDQFIISQITSVALFNALSDYLCDVSIKWPNDIYFQDKKICGMLIENDIDETGIIQSVLGIGLNVNQDPFRGNAPNPISMKQISGREYDKKELLKNIITQISSLYEESKINKSGIPKKYKEHLYHKDGFHLYEDFSGDLFEAKIENVELSGHLVLKTANGDIKRFAFKEIIFR